MLIIGANGDRGLGALNFWIASRYLANLTSAIPLRNATTCRGAQDDDAKHFSSPGEDELEGGPSVAAILFQIPSRPEVHLKSKIPAAYLRAAHAYMLISMPTGTSTIFGVFQAMVALLAKTGRTPPSRTN